VIDWIDYVVVRGKKKKKKKVKRREKKGKKAESQDVAGMAIDPSHVAHL